MENLKVTERNYLQIFGQGLKTGILTMYATL